MFAGGRGRGRRTRARGQNGSPVSLHPSRLRVSTALDDWLSHGVSRARAPCTERLLRMATICTSAERRGHVDATEGSSLARSASSLPPSRPYSYVQGLSGSPPPVSPASNLYSVSDAWISGHTRRWASNGVHARASRYFASPHSFAAPLGLGWGGLGGVGRGGVRSGACPGQWDPIGNHPTAPRRRLDPTVCAAGTWSFDLVIVGPAARSPLGIDLVSVSPAAGAT